MAKGAAAAAAGGSPAREMALPLALLREIFCFAHAPALVPSNAAPDSAFATRATAPSTAGLRSLARVCSTWHRVATELLTYFAQRELALQFTVGSEEAEHCAHLTHLRAHGHAVLHLRVRIVTRKQPLWWETLGSSSSSTATSGSDTSLLEAQWVDWDALFQLLPHVQRLDLSGVPLHHYALSDILTSCATHCTNVQALVLPKRDPSFHEAVDASIDETLRSLYTALTRWHAFAPRESLSNASRSLRQLTVPSLSGFDIESTSEQFLEAVTTLCPHIEYLDGWKVSYSEQRFVRSDLSLSVSPSSAWIAFCATCSRLREFSWVVVPFADAFFRPFGATAKPQLTHLQLTYNAAAPFRIIRRAYSTDGVCALLNGVSGLKVLDVVLHRIQSAHALVYPHLDEMIDGAVFDDRFAVHLAQTCRKLATLRIRAVAEGFPLLSAITDTGVLALATMTQLEHVDVLGVKCSAASLLALVLARGASSKIVRVRELGSRFGAVATELLALLCGNAATASEGVAKHLEQTKHTPRLLSLACRRGFVFSKQALETAATELQRRHPHVRFVAVLVDKSVGAAASSSDRTSRLRSLLVHPDVARVQKLVVYTNEALLGRTLQAHVRHSRSSCVIHAGPSEGMRE